ncbi:hypothetical protein GCM10027174_14260 [Salinifilum aidingensis]
MSTDRASLEAALSEVDFPASKEDLVAHAQNHGADEETVRSLRALPVAEYENLTEIVRSVPLDMAEEEGQSSSDKAQQASRHQHSGLAEHQRETPDNPIVEELGENRGS